MSCSMYGFLVCCRRNQIEGRSCLLLRHLWSSCNDALHMGSDPNVGRKRGNLRRI